MDDNVQANGHRRVLGAVLRSPARLMPGRRASVAAQLIGVFVVAVLLTSTLIAVNVIGAFHDARRAAEAQVGREATAQSHDLETYVAGYDSDALSSLAQQPGLDTGRAADCRQAVAQLSKLVPGGGIGLIRRHGGLVCSSGDFKNMHGQPWLADLYDKGAVFTGPLVVDGVPFPVVTIGVTVKTARGTLALIVQQPSKGGLLYPAASRVDLLVVDRPTGLVLDSWPKKSLIGTYARAMRVPDDVARITRTARIQGTDWVVVAGVPEATALADAESGLRHNIVYGALLLLVLLGLGALVYRRIARPTRRLRAAIEELAAAEVEGPDGRHVPEDGPRELAQLGAAFNGMVDARVRSEARLASLVRHGSDLVFAVDVAGDVIYATPSVETLLGRQVTVVTGRPFLDLVHPADRDMLELRMSRLQTGAAGRSGADTRLDFRLERADGGTRDVEARVQNLLDEPAVNGIVITCHDITERKRAEAQLAHAALHDALTGLPNRTLVLDRLAHLLARTGRSGIDSAVLFLDLDRFKLVNDSSGHAAGDDLLVQVAQRLSAITRPGDTLGRFGGDEFVLVCESLNASAGAIAVAERVLAAMQAPFYVADQEMFVTASVGIAMVQPGDEPGDLLRDADAALYRAKDGGRAGYALFDDEMRAQVRRRVDVGNKLRHAVSGDGLFLDYQPIVSLSALAPVGVEALLRYRGNDGVMPPDEFIPVAEETGLIVPIGEWVMREACRQLRQWQQHEQCPSGMHVSVNVSARQLAQPDFVDAVGRAIADSGIDAGQLTLEVTESVLMTDPDAVAAMMVSLRGLGVAMAIDDFGTGFSSLGYLERLPVDELKVDRAFVAPLGRRTRATAIVESVVDLAHAVGLTVVAEGVEEVDQVALLTDMGCDLAQGFHFARPLAPEVAFDYLRALAIATV